MAPPPPPEEIAQLMRFIAEKTKNVKSPVNVSGLAAEFKEKSGSLMAFRGLRSRNERNRQKIYKMDEFDMDTKVKMMFALGAPIDKEFLNELKKLAEVKVDRKRRITKYKGKDGSLELKGSHGQKYIHRSMHSDRWQKVCQKANDDESEEEGDEDANGQKNHENKKVDLVRFLIARTENATSPLSFPQLTRDYKEEFKCSESLRSIRHQITRFRQRIHKMNQFDMPTKVKMLFALSASIEADFSQKLQEDAIVELDGELKIKKYKAKDGSLELEGDHSVWAKRKVNNKKKISVATAQKQSALFNQRKRARFSYSSSEASEDDEKSMTLEDDPSMNSETTNNFDHGRDDFDYDAPVNNHYDENLEHNVKDSNSGRNIATPEVIDDDDKEEAGSSSFAKIESMSLLEFLTHLRPPIVQYTPTLIPRIDENIKKLEEKDNQIPLHRIIESLESCIQILNTPDEMDSDENTTSLSDFYYHLGMAMCNITHSTMDDIHVKIRKLATTGDKNVSMEHISYATGEALDKILQ